MLRIEIHGNAPLEGGSGHAKVLKTRLQEVVHHLIFPGNRLNELRMLLNVLHQTVRILGHLEEVGLLLGLLHRTSTVRTLAVHQLGLCPEGLTGRTVPALIGALVDVALVVHLLEHLLHLALVVCIGGADKFVIGGIHEIPDGLDLAGHLVYIGLRGHTGCLCLLLDLLSVLIGAGLEAYIIALETLVAGNGVCQHDLISVSDMRLAGSIGNRCRHVKRFFLHFFTSFHRHLSDSPTGGYILPGF